MLVPKHSESLDRDGYCVLTSVGVGDLLAYAAALGSPEPDPRDRVLVKDIRPQHKEAANTNTLSSRYGMGAFPVHTEAAYLQKSPRFLLLYCVAAGSGQRTTVLLDTTALSGRLPKERRTGTWIVKAGRRPFLCDAIWHRDRNRIGIRYDRECLFPRGRTALQEEQMIRDHIASSPSVSIGWAPGQLLIIDNHRMLHGRGGSNNDDRDRWLKRVLVGEA